MNGWIGVDLDGTLAHHEPGDGVDSIGKPIPAMVARVKQWLAEGWDVRIFTARVADTGSSMGYKAGFAGQINVRAPIESWCKTHIGKVLPITNEKDFLMVELWDDRAVQVIPNTGKRADGEA